MLTYIIRRLLLMIPTLIGVTAVVFFVMAMAPGRFEGIGLNDQGAQKQGEEARRIRQYMMRRYGLDKPYVVQYGRWLNQVSPVGFVFSANVKFSDEQLKAASDELASDPSFSSPLQLRRGEAIAQGLAQYQDIEPVAAARQLRGALVDPVEGLAIYKLIHTTPAERFVTNLKATAPQDIEQARRDLLTELSYDTTGVGRVLFGRIPTIKMPDLGTSLRGRSVTSMIGEALPITLLLNAITIPLTYGIAMLLGIFAGRHRGKFFDVFSGFTLLMLWSIPTIWAGIMLLTFLCSREYVQWFPVSGLHSLQADSMPFLPTWGAFGGTLGFSVYVLSWASLAIGGYCVLSAMVALGISGVGRLRRKAAAAAWESLKAPTLTLIVGAAIVLVSLLFILTPLLPRTIPGPERGWLIDTAWHLVLPVFILTYGSFAVLAKLTRGSILENIQSDFVRTARAKGVSERDILFRHVFRNSLLPLITVTVSIFPAMIGGSVIVESIFSIEGMGKLMVDAAKQNDSELVMAMTLIAGLIGLTADIARDVWYAIADPRVSYQ